MKKALSLFLAFVMVALMIPFSAFITSAAGDTADIANGSNLAQVYSLDFSTISSETELEAAGWYHIVNSGKNPVAPAYQARKQGANDAEASVGMKYTLDADSQLVFTGVEFDAAENYVIEYTFKYDICSHIIRLGFAHNGETYIANGNAGNSDASCITMRSSGGYDRTGVYLDSAYTVNANPSAGNTISAESIIASTTDFDDCQVRIFVNAGKVQYMTVTVGGVVNYVKNNAAIDVTGYFGFSHIGSNGADADNPEPTRAMLFKNFAVYKDTVYETDFTTIATDNGFDGDINPSLPEGFVANNDTTPGQISAVALENPADSANPKNGYTSINYTAGNNGVLLGGENTMFAMNSKAAGVTAAMRNGTQDYVIEVTWDTSHKFANLRFGWTETEPTYVNGTATIAMPSKSAQAIVQCGAGNTGGAGTFIMTSQGNLPYNGTWGDENGTAHGSKVDPLRTIVNEEIPLTFSLVVKSGVLETIHISYNGIIVESYYNHGKVTKNEVQYDASAMPATGYFVMWHSGWGGNNSININSIRVKALADDEAFVEPLNASKFFQKTGNVVHYADLTDKADADAIPYDTCGDVNYRDNALWVEDGDSLAGFIKVDKELFRSLSSYTVEFSMAAGSASRILNVSFNANDDASTKFGYADNGRTNVKMRFSTEGYGLDNGNVAGTLSTAIPTNFGVQMNADGFKLSCVIVDGALVCYVVTLADNSSVTIVPDRKMTAVSGGISLCQTTTGGVTDGFGLEAVKIIAAPVYGADVSVTDEILAPEGKAVVKVANQATVIDAAEFTVADYLADAVTVKENGVAFVAETTVVPTAGKVYAPMNLADTATYISNQKITADTSLRLASNPGIRYTSAFEDSLIMDLLNKTEAITRIEMGTLITVEDHKNAMGKDMTIENLEAYQAAKRTETGNDGYTAYLTVTGDVSNLYTESVFRGSVIGVQSFTKNYVAVGYVTIEFGDTATFTLYSDEATASVKTLAAAIVADAEAMATYSENEQAALNYLATYTEA